MGDSSHSSEKLKIFISYSRSDMTSADALVAALESEGFTVTIDRRDLPYGEKWQGVLYEYIRDCDTVVFLVSERSIQSQWVRWELQQVTDLRKRLIPIMFELCLPESLPPAIASIEVMPKQGVFSIELHLSTLAQALNTNRAWVMEATKLQSRTLDWINADKTSALLLRGAALEGAERWRRRMPKVETIPSNVLDFLLSSRQGANRHQRNWIIGSIIVAVGAIILALAAYWKSIEAERQRNAAVAQTIALTSLSSGNEPSRSILLAREALRRSQDKPEVTTIAAHRNAVLRFGPTPLLEAARRGLTTAEVSDPYAPARDETVTALEISGNGRWLLVGAQDNGTRELWLLDLTHKDPSSTIRVIDTGLINENGGDAARLRMVAVSNSGRFIAVAPGSGQSFDPDVLVFDLHGKNQYIARLAKWSGDRPDYAVPRFSQDEQYLAYGNHFWRVHSDRSELEPILLPVNGRLANPFFSIDSKRIGVAMKSDKVIEIKTWETSSSLREERMERFASLAAARTAYPALIVNSDSEEKEYLTVSPDARWEVSINKIYTQEQWTTSSRVRRYDKAGKLEAEIMLPGGKNAKMQDDKVPHDGFVQDAAFSSDGRWLATIGSTLQLWDLAAPNPFSKPFLDFSAPGTHVAIDPAGHWLASFGQRLQIWDLTLETPEAFPIEPKSIANVPQVAGREDLKMSFLANGDWFLIESRLTAKDVAEFWDLRFDNIERDGNLARRNLSAMEWRSFFGADHYRKTFLDQPIEAEPLREADDLARAGNIAEAVKLYERVSTVDPDLKLDPKRRAAKLAAQFYWVRGENSALEGEYDSSVQFLKQAKDMNSAIPWEADVRAGQLWARNWSKIVDRLRDPTNRDSNNESNGMKDYVEGLLSQLRLVTQRYPRLRFDTKEETSDAEIGERLYQFGLQALGDGLPALAEKFELAEALRLRAILVREMWSMVPTETSLREAFTKKATERFRVQLQESNLIEAGRTVHLVERLDAALGARMQSILELVSSYDQLKQVDKAGDLVRTGSQTRRFRRLMEGQHIAIKDSRLEFMDARLLNRMCWDGTTRYGLASAVLSLCETAIAKAQESSLLKSELVELRDSRGMAYAVLGRIDEAIADFETFVASYPDGKQTRLRREWIKSLKACKSDPVHCRNPLASPTYRRSIS